MKAEQPEQKANTPRLQIDAFANAPSPWQAWDRPDSNWNQAAALTPQVDPFCCRTEWQLSYHEAMTPTRRLIIREVPGSLIAFTLLNSMNPSQKIYGPIESHWFFGCPLLGPAAVDLLQDFIGSSATPTNGCMPIYGISGLDPVGPLYREIVRKLRPRCDFSTGKREILCSASLDGGLDGFLAKRSAKHRQGLRYQSRRAARNGVSFERHVPQTVTQAAQLYARILAVEETSWKGIDNCGMTEGLSRTYYDCMLRRLSASASARVMFARHAGRDIGYIFGAVVGDVYRGQQFSYADDWKSYSIGNLLQLELITWLCEDGVRRYDMGPMMDYKVHWTEIMRPIVNLVIRPR